MGAGVNVRAPVLSDKQTGGMETLSQSYTVGRLE